MSELSPSADLRLESDRHPASDSVKAVRGSLSDLAHVAVAACAADACIVSWRNPYGGGIVRVPAGQRWAAPLNAVQAAVERRLEPAAGLVPAAVHLDALESTALVGSAAPEGRRCEIFARSAVDGPNHVTVIVVAARESGKPRFEALVTLISADALRIITENEHAISRHFWRRRALEIGERVAQGKAELSRGADAQRRLDNAVVAALKLRSRNRFASLGAIFARLGPFDGWILAIADGDELRSIAATAVTAPIPRLDRDSALTASFIRKTAIHRTITQLKSAAYHEDRLLAHFSSYLCVPFEGGAIALAARHPIDDAAVARVETLAARLGPLIRSWHVEAEVLRLQQLVRNLGLRMFGAIDSERARIARDLHDHQAQLLAAGRIALEAGPDEARGIFKQLEEALRLRVRELRPATLGRSTLEDALRYELRRLGDAGIRGRLIHTNRMNSLTRPVQQLCYQVAREALSNVSRHSAATRVAIAIEKHRGRVRMTVRDNGVGIAAGAAAGTRDGIGLSGLRERLALMGGRLQVESRAGATRLIADIPEPV